MVTAMVAVEAVALAVGVMVVGAVMDLVEAGMEGWMMALVGALVVAVMAMVPAAVVVVLLKIAGAGVVARPAVPGLAPGGLAPTLMPLLVLMMLLTQLSGPQPDVQWVVGSRSCWGLELGLRLHWVSRL